MGPTATHVAAGRPFTFPVTPDGHAAGLGSLVVGMGCFWGAEEVFRTLDGVTDTAVGYAGGAACDPTYRDVCSETTGHAESVLITYEPQRISMTDLLTYFWENHDPTQGDRQGNDIGSQYRSIILTTRLAQHAVAVRSMDIYQQRLHAAGRGTITTTIASLEHFWRAEDYHQRYLVKNPGAYSNQRFNVVTCPTGAIRRVEAAAVETSR